MQAHKCDRCGHLFERMCVSDIRIEHYIHPYGGNWIDLCSDCQKQLEDWIKSIDEKLANCPEEYLVTSDDLKLAFKKATEE